MSDTLTDSGSSYSPLMGLVYVFNLIVGTGALTMPLAFATAGWLPSLIIVVLLAFMSYLTVTFVLEAMSAANAVLHLTQSQDTGTLNSGTASSLQRSNSDAGDEDDEKDGDETKPLLAAANAADGVVRCSGTGSELPQEDMFEIRKRVEMGQMASMFFNKVGSNLFYICIIIYLYGDLAIYAVAVPKSMRDVACTFNASSCNLTDTDPCWPSLPDITRIDSYRIFLAVYTVLLGPFLFFNVQKTILLQIFTTFVRWLAFSMMIILVLISLSKGKGQGSPKVADFSGVPNLFGVCVYSFMCHHSLPSLATPIKNKSRLYQLFAADYTLILAFYCFLSFTGIFCFSQLEDLYTLNFGPNTCNLNEEPIPKIAFIQYFLALFPVIVLSTNFPIIGITLRNNLKTLFHRKNKPYPWLVDKIVFPLVSLVPPTIIAFITHDVQVLVGITGSYAGAVIQYIVPAALVFCSRRQLAAAVSPVVNNKYTSPFKHGIWLLLVLVWAVVCLILVTVNHIITRK